MKALQNFVLILLLVAMVFSCKKDQEITGITPDENSLLGFKTDTFSIETYSVLSDSIPSTSGTTKFLGAYHSDEIGLVKAKIFTSLIPATIGQTYKEGGTVLNVNLSLSISETYGTPFNQEFEVLQTNESLVSGKAYLSSDSLSYGSSSLGSFTLNSKDTGAFEFPLNNSFGDQVLSQGNSVLASEANFLAFLKGIVISPKNTPGNNAGVLYGIRSTDIKISIIFSNTDENSVTTLDTIVFHQPTSAKTFYQATQTLDGSEVKTGIDNPTEGNQQFYLQGIGGVKAKINFPNLAAWYSNKRLINKATLVLPVQNAANTEFSKPSTLTFHPISNSTSAGTQSTFDVTSNSYKLEIHNTLIADLEAKKTLTYNLSILNAYAHPEQVTLLGNKNTTTPAKLVIYYTDYK